MCDEANLKEWAKEAVSRREFAALSGAVAMTACTPSEALPGQDAASLATSLKETAITFKTADGTMDALFVHPSVGEHPAVILWPDIASIRESKRNIARALASEGYAVLVLNPYYRDVSGEQFTDFADFIEKGGFQSVRPWRGKLDADTVGSDAKAAVAWLDAQDAVDTAKGIGTQGYCMGGPFTVWSAAAVPDRIKAAASFHGGGLVRKDYDKSPHKVLTQAKAKFLIAVAQNDDAKAPQVKLDFADAAKAAGREAIVEVYKGDHGWMVPDSPSFAPEAAKQGYEDLLELYSTAL